MAVAVMLCLCLTLAFLAGTTLAQSEQQKGCVSSCEGLPDGNYQSCYSCTSYCACRLGNLIDFIPCPPRYFWDKTLGRCRYGTCKFRTPEIPFCRTTERLDVSQEICETTSWRTMVTTDTQINRVRDDTVMPRIYNLLPDELVIRTVTNTEISPSTSAMIIPSTRTDIDLELRTRTINADRVTERTTSTIINVDSNVETAPAETQTYRTSRTLYTCLHGRTRTIDETITQTHTTASTTILPRVVETTSEITVTSTSTIIRQEVTTVPFVPVVTTYTSTSTLCNVQTRDANTDDIVYYRSRSTPITVSTSTVNERVTNRRTTTTTPIVLSTSVISSGVPAITITDTQPAEREEVTRLRSTIFRAIEPTSTLSITSTRVVPETEVITASDLFCSTSREDVTIVSTVLITETLEVLTVTCTGKLLVFFDGVLQIAPASELDNVDEVSTFEIPRDTIVVALECCRDEEISGQSGIIASISNGVVTDDSWMCSPIHRTGWTMPNFELDASYGPPALRNRAGVPDIASSARWIWARGAGRVWGNSFCRKMLM